MEANQLGCRRGILSWGIVFRVLCLGYCVPVYCVIGIVSLGILSLGILWLGVLSLGILWLGILWLGIVHQSLGGEG